MNFAETEQMLDEVSKLTDQEITDIVNECNETGILNVPDYLDLVR